MVEAAVAVKPGRIAILALLVAALGAGVAARLLLDGDPTQRANAWSKLGDVSLDIAERELAARASR